MTNRRGWVPDGVVSNALPGNHSVVAAPQESSLFDDWLKEDAKPLGGRPTGGVEQAIRNGDDWFFSRGMQCIRATKIWPQPWAPFELEPRFGLVAEHGAAWGALIRQAKAAGLLRKIDHAPSQRPSANGREVVRYRSVDWVGADFISEVSR